MKLLNYTSRYLALLLLLLITIWAVLLYYAMLDEIYDSLDDGLENQKMLMVQRALEDPSILTQDDPEFKKHVYNFTSISKKSYTNFKESYRDTLMYMLNEKDYEPVRVYESAVAYDDEYYKLKIITSMVEEDDLMHDLAFHLLGLYLILVTCIILLNNVLLRKIWKPFNNLIDQLRNFKIEKNTPITIPETNIEEFSLLNDTVDKLIKKASDSYIAQKHFIENASHELQTPLAISINKLELFLENNELNDQQSKELASVLDNLGRLTRLNRSMLLLSKIENQQFLDEELVDFVILSHKVIKDFEDFAQHKSITIKLVSQVPFIYKINKDLAIILLTNLVKNAIVHGKSNTTVVINIEQSIWSVSNNGKKNALPKDQLFTRFKNTNTTQKSTGLGLAIAKAIATKYDIDINYHFNDQHVFTLHFPYKH
ncbi:ATP-binding protein [Psychroserpens mesophilus]|uniref:PorY family sensor histidine kinase n=1 Tax=Psychroserpens mesophilus TaxID=325473 RepID=UPI003D660DB9